MVMDLQLTADPNAKPLCFGSPSVFSLESDTCKACSCFAVCHDAAYLKLKVMSKSINVDDMLARFEQSTSRAELTPFKTVDAQTTPVVEDSLKLSVALPERTTKLARVKVDLTPADQALIGGMPKKVQVKLRRLMQLNIDKLARAGIGTRTNPFPFVGNGYLHVAYDMLIHGGFTRATLRQCLQQKLGWTEGTAFPHVTAVTWLFPAMQISVEERGVFLPNPKLQGHT